MWVIAGFGLAFLCGRPAVADEEWNKLETEFQAAYEKWSEQMQKLHEQGGGMGLNPATMPPDPMTEFRPRFRAYAEKHAGKPEAIPALGRLLTGGMPFMGGHDDSAAWALARLTRDHAADPAIKDYLEMLQLAVMSVGEDAVIEFLDTVAKKNPDKEVKGAARLQTAQVLYEGSPFAMMMSMGETPERAAKKKRAAELLRQIKKDYADTPLAQRADDMLFAIEHLAVGAKVPEVVGKDADGKEVWLSQFSGKVVAIVFWATWCKPCMEMLPHERELMEHYAGKPFTILGINVDDTVAELKKAMKKEKITWPTIHDGGAQTSVIARKWRVQSFPTIYVVDHEGVIRYKDVPPFQLESVVAELVAKAEGGGGMSNGE